MVKCHGTLPLLLVAVLLWNAVSVNAAESGEGQAEEEVEPEGLEKTFGEYHQGLDDHGNIVIWINGTSYRHEESCEELVVPGSLSFWGFIGGAFISTMFAGIMSGLTVGLMSFDEKNLSILMTQSKDNLQRKRAHRVHEMVKHHHFLLVTLLLWNAAAFESLPLFLDRLVPSWLAVLISVTFILIFGEIIPQAVCTGPNRLAVGASAYYLVKVLEFFAFPVAWLFGKLLDNVLGHRDDRESMFLYVPREALGLKGSGGLLGQMALVELHGESTELELSPSSNASKSFGKEQDDKDIEQSAGILAASHGTGLDDVSLDDGDDDDRGSSRAAVVPT